MTKRDWKFTILELNYDLLTRLEKTCEIDESAAYQKIVDSTYAEILELTGFSESEIPSKHWESVKFFAQKEAERSLQMQ